MKFSENLMKESLISRRLVYDQLRSFNTKISEIPITRQMVLSCKGAHNQYTRYLEQKQKEKVNDQKSLKRKLKQEEIMNAK